MCWLVDPRIDVMSELLNFLWKLEVHLKLFNLCFTSSFSSLV